MHPVQVVISSEHSGNDIPEKFREAFLHSGKALNSHRGIDFGSAYIAKRMQEAFSATLYETTISRLLVDCNRSLHRNDLFSEFSAVLDETTRNEILECYYYPHRKAVEKFVAANSSEAMILHLSIHTFTPVWHGIERSVDIGLLFDELRSNETALCKLWQDELRTNLKSKKTVLNSPYTGAEDGLTAHLRKLFPDENYMGIEIEVNQKYAETAQMEKICSALIETLKSSISTLNQSLLIPNK